MDAEVAEAMRDMRDVLLDEMRAGFRGVHSRQDTTNGRITKGEIMAGEHGIRLKNVEREVFHRRRNDRPGVIVRDRMITERDFKIIVGTLVAMGGVITFIKTLGPGLVRLFTP